MSSEEVERVGGQALVDATRLLRMARSATFREPMDRDLRDRIDGWLDKHASSPAPSSPLGTPDLQRNADLVSGGGPTDKFGKGSPAVGGSGTGGQT